MEYADYRKGRLRYYQSGGRFVTTTFSHSRQVRRQRQRWFDMLIDKPFSYATEQRIRRQVREGIMQRLGLEDFLKGARY